MMLQVHALSSAHGRVEVIRGIDLQIGASELVALVGANGAGKTTLLRTISGLHGNFSGKVTFESRDISRFSPDRRVRSGMAHVPEGRQVFAPMTVEDNLGLGGYTRARADIDKGMAEAFEMFPILAERRRQIAGTLSGGEQQMLAISRALMSRPRLLLLDEPSMGLAPFLVDQILSAVAHLREQGMTVLLVEQNARAALRIADRGYVIETGRIVLDGTGEELLSNPQVQEAYLGI